MKNWKMSLLKSSGAVALATTLVTSAVAGEKAGNGGNARICFDDPAIAKRLTRPDSPVSHSIPDEYLPRISSIEVLDLAEARRPVGFGSQDVPLIEMNEGEAPEQFAERIARRFDPFSIPSGTGGKMLGLSEVFLLGKKMLKSIHIVDDAVIPASDIAPLVEAGPSCVYSTIAIQRSMGNGSRELFVDSRLYRHERFSQMDRAVLILHELFLAAAQENRITQKEIPFTEGVRDLVAVLLKRDVSLADIIEVLNRRQLFAKYSSRMDGGGYTYFETFVEYSTQWIRLKEVQSLFNDFLKRQLDLLTEETRKAESDFVQEVSPLFATLPNWYVRDSQKRGLGPTLSRDLPKKALKKTFHLFTPPTLTSEEEWTELPAPHQATLEQIRKIRNRYLEARVFPAVRQTWEREQGSRMERLSGVLEIYQRSPLNREVFENLKEAAVELVRSTEGIEKFALQAAAQSEETATYWQRPLAGGEFCVRWTNEQTLNRVRTEIRVRPDLIGNVIGQ